MKWRFKMNEQLIQIRLPWACFGLIVHAGIVVESAPIARWSVGKTIDEVIHHFEGKGGKAEFVPSGSVVHEALAQENLLMTISECLYGDLHE